MVEQIKSTITPPKYDAMYYLIMLMRFKWVIMAFVILVTGLTIIVTLKMPNMYSATVSVVPPKSSGTAFEGMLGNISSALKDFGLTKLSGKSEGNYSFLVILDSKAVKDSIIRKYQLDKIYELPQSHQSAIYTQFNNNLKITCEPEGNFTITFTDEDSKRAADIANDYVNVANFVNQKIFQTESRINREYIEDRLNDINKSLDLVSDSINSFSSQKMVFSPTDQARSISSALAEMKAEIMKQEIVEQLLVNKFGENDPYTIQQKSIVSQLKDQMQKATTEPGFGGNFPLNKAAFVGMNFLKLYSEFEAFTKVKAFLMPTLEEAKLDEKRMTQVLFVIDSAVPPDIKSQPKRSLIVMSSFVGSFALIVLLIIIFDSILILRKNFKIRKAEISNS